MKPSLSEKLGRFKSGLLYVGVDLGMDSNVSQVKDERANVLATYEFPHTRSGYDSLYRRVEALVERHGASGFVVGMEPTNYFWTLLATDLEEREIDYYLVNPFTVRKHREGDQLDRSRDDRRDASAIADLLREGKYTETHLLHGAYAELRQLGTVYARLRQDSGRQKTLIRNMAGQLFPELLREFKHISCATALAMLKAQAAAIHVKDLSVEDFVAAIRTASPGQRLAVSKLRRVWQQAATSVGVREGVDALQLALRVHIETLQTMQSHEKVVGQALIKAFEALPEARYLCSVPALGILTSAMLLAEIGIRDATRMGTS